MVDQESWRSFVVKKLEATVDTGPSTRIKRSMNKASVLPYFDSKRHIDNNDACLSHVA